MDFTADVYLTAAKEHGTAAFDLYQARRYTLAHYVAGLAVECIFRAYRYRIDPAFDERHDLRLLAKSARFDDIVPERHVEKISAAMGVVVTQWLNNHRYRSEASLESFLSDKKLNVGIKGDFVKENSRRIVNAALDLVSLGVSRWKNSSGK